MREALSAAIQQRRLQIRSVPPFAVEPPRHAAFGDLACDVPLVLGRQLGACPRAIASTIVEFLHAPHGWLAEVAVGGPGFVDFRFAPHFWRALAAEAVAAGGAYGRSDAGLGRRVRVELVAGDADATAARGTAVADALARLLEHAGAQVERTCLPPGVKPRAADATVAAAGSFRELVGVVAGDRGRALPHLKATLATLGAPGAALRVLPVQPVRLTRDGTPVRVRGEAGELLREIGPDAMRFLLLLARAARPIDLDLELAKRERIDNPLFFVQYAHARLARRRREGETTPDRVPAPSDVSGLDPAETEVLRVIAAWPEVVDTATRALEPDRIARFTVELATAVHRWLNRHGARPGGRTLTRARLALAGCLERVLCHALALCNASAPEAMGRRMG